MSGAAAIPEDQSDVRPVVSTGSSGKWGMWVFFALLAVGGALLFSALTASREASEVPAIAPVPASDNRIIASPQPLQLPDRFLEPTQSQPGRAEQGAEPRREVPVLRNLAPRIISPPVPQPIALPPSMPAGPPATQPDRTPQVVFEQRSSAQTPSLSDEASGEASRVTAARFLNPDRAIPQGTVIQAVLETALDSTRAGGVRALVQRDVSSFDGSRVLIPRGSRLYGEYEATLQPGQKRALVQWTRLIRPDGVTIALDSPSSDPLGRAGIKGKVDTKFFQRFGGALLQSVLDIGVGIAVNRATDGVIVALPGSTQNVRVTEPDQIQPSLKVKHGTSVSVFVARDLDFSTVES
ncbi:MAG: TrbI/VirB10 family protein [Erythrobacter sp.]